MAYIEFRNIEKFYGSNQVLKGIDLKIEKGQFVTLLGPSGCGKSTLLRCLAGLEEVNGGRIFLDGEDITDKEPKERNIGMVSSVQPVSKYDGGGKYCIWTEA